jgi:hypothetical protein
VRLFKNGGRLLVAAAFLSMTACNAGAVPRDAENAMLGPFGKTDTKSILKQLKKEVVIGSTVDSKNGDRGPNAIAVVAGNKALTRGQLLVCNFDDRAGTPGEGTTIELLDPKAGSKPATFAQNSALAGCDGLTLDPENTVFASAYTASDLALLTSDGVVRQTHKGAPIAEPFGDVYAKHGGEYSAAYVFIADAKTGSILSLSYDRYGTGRVLQVATGFGVDKKEPPATLGPSGLQYDSKHDKLYIVDGADDTIVAFSNASDLLVKNEIVVEPGGKTFRCMYPQTTCASLVYSGKPLDAPVASAMLPDGNLVVANTHGGNLLVELTPAGHVLGTKLVDTRKTAGVFGLAATGTSDSDTVLYFTDTNFNDLRELER